MLVSKLLLPSYLLQTDVISMFDNPTIIVVLGVLGVLSLIIVGGGFYLLNQKNQQEPVTPDQTQHMRLNRLMAEAQFLQEKAHDFGEVALEKIDDILDEYQEILPYMEDLGVKVEGFSINVGLLPKIKTSLVASLDSIEVAAVKQVKAENKNHKLLVSILNSVLLAKKCNDCLEEASISLFKDIVVDMELGIPPGISVKFR